MELIKSQTLKNLAKSFAGESQAGLRYQIGADLCLAQGYYAVADELKALAKNEVNHAKVFYRFITEELGVVENIDVEAGYPYDGTTILDILERSIINEVSEADNIYPSFAKIAKEEGFEDIYLRFNQIAKVEMLHKAKFEYLYNSLKNDTLYKSTTPKMWECSECGHMHESLEAWDICPLCGASQGFVKVVYPEIKI